jgi:uncharacterized protein (DUF433 family)
VLERLAHDERRPLSAVIRDLLEEALRMRHCPGIIFADGPTGRRPVIAGTGLEVWEIIQTYKECGEDFEKLGQTYDWLTPQQLRSALAYWRLYPEEIEEEIRRQEALSEEEARARWPHLFPLR